MTKMLSDDFIYGFLLIASIPFGLIIRTVGSKTVKEAVSSSAGCFIMLAVCRSDIYHAFLVIIVNCMLLKFFSQSRYLTLYSFIWCFGYLAFFRTCHWYGLSKPRPHSNAAQLLLTLRMVGIASEVFEMEKLKKESEDQASEQNELKLKYCNISTDVRSLLSYSFCYIGLLTGPFYTCRTYQDMLASSQSSRIDIITPLKKTLRPLPVCAALFIIVGHFFKVQEMKEDAFYDLPCYKRYLHLVFCYTWFRTRFYSAWILAECMSITACLGAYDVRGLNKSGAGPTDLQALDESPPDSSSQARTPQVDFLTIQNIKPYDTEFATTFRASIRTWNMTVQYWLVVNIYKKLIPGGPRLFRGVLLMLVSAFWHGVHPGYYATLLSAPFLILVEDSMAAGVRVRLSPRARTLYDYIASFVRMRLFEYFSIGVFLLDYSDIWRYWSSLGFFGHYTVMALIAVGQIASRLGGTKHRDARAEERIKRSE